MKETRLRGSTGSSRILIGASLEDLAAYAPPERTVLLVDTKVARLHPEILAGFRWLDAGRGERAKRLKNVERICRRLLELGADRSTLIVGVGGGVTCDIAGLTASLYMRGVPFGFAPTTLLAQADAAIGGKNGVNLDGA
ncbi:MAG: 3-dehydroquinate synthase, partial [Planctomycetaceae bacterium]